MAELVDAVDSKSTSSDRVPVQVRIRAPNFIIILCKMVNIFLFTFYMFKHIFIDKNIDI